MTDHHKLHTQVLFHEDLSNHTPLRIGGPALEWICVYSEAALLETMQRLKKEKKKWIVSWPFQDMLCRDGGYNGVIIRLCGEFEQIQDNDDGVLMGSAALWSSLQQKYFSIFGHWSGSVGGLFENNQEHHLKGCSLLLRWLQGKKILEEKIDVVDKKFSRPTKNKILLSLTIKKSPKNRLASPKRTGEIFLSPSRMSIQDLFTQYQLCGIRLKNWLLSRQNPGRMIQLGTGSCRDLLILHQGLNERVKKISGKTIALSLSPFGKEQPHARAKK